ncbi:energy transducer TonB [Bdellovibrio sp. NC01]|uniref:energy transducer TonB n=1 Tax=Bdellovibrio sp. NC01 TaxID=2220073 RepID=UPI00115AB269|nr:TonB family protein [Bdellovibrio sp. NC01]QDK36234.1 energy transducer TonB [Bdellovibrio sp. NC01]
MNELEEIEQQNDEKLSRGIGISFALHAVILSIFALKAAFFTPEQIDFSQAVRVDMVGLPDKLDKTPPAASKEEAKPALPDKNPPAEKPVEKTVEKKPEPAKPEPVKPTPAPKVAAKSEVKVPKETKPEGINLEKTKHQQQSAIEKLKAMAALEKIKEDVASQNKAKPVPATGKDAAGAAKVKGNVLSPGTALSGLSKLQHDSYAADLDHHIKQHWAVPEWLAKRDYKAQAKVYIDARGNIIGRKIIKSSGNPSYDDAVLDTIDQSAPFPAPPEKFVSIVEVDGITIGFPE